MIPVIRNWIRETYIFRNYFCGFVYDSGASLVAQLVENPPAMPENLVRFLNRQDPLEKG